MATERRLIAYDPITFESFTRHETKHIDPYYDPYGEGFTDAVDRIEGWLKNNTVDAVEVVHGRWEWLGLYRYNGEGWIGTCSVCKERLRLFVHNYCPNCGADMRDGDGNA